MPAKTHDDDLLMSLVEFTLSLPADERKTYLQGACSGDSELFEQVWNYVHWEQRMNGFLLDPLFPPVSIEHPFEPGELVHGRFRILREVAQGGMGIVYEANDEKLERRIAIKCAKSGFSKILTPEVRNASTISHPNVCKIFEIHTAATVQGEIDFLTMEFLEGETLGERLRRGPLSHEEARAIAMQLCAGLAEAHRNHVIHGDLKSNNIILTMGMHGGTRAVITDFGLARKPEAKLVTNQPWEMGGTPDYMAPEMWRGEKPSVATDVYALGVIFHELISGRRPNRLDVSARSVNSEEGITRVPQAVHPKWDKILSRCLDPDPLQRFRDVDEIAAALARHPPWWLLVAAAAAAVLAIATGIITYHRATVPPESVRLMMLPLEAGPDAASLTARLYHDTSLELTHLKGNARVNFTLIPEIKLRQAHVDTLEKARSLVGATHVLHGTVGKENGNVVLDSYLTDTRSRVDAKHWKVMYAPAQLKYAPGALAGMVTASLRLPPLATRASVNAAARQNYLSGLSYMRRDSTIDQALVSLGKAVAEDPDSALAFAALGEAQWDKYNILTKDRTWRESAAKSAREAEIRNPDLQQLHQLLGSLKYDVGWYDQAAAEFQRAIELDPTDGDAYKKLGMDYEANNEMDKALEAYRRSIEAGPGNYRSYVQFGVFLDNQAKYSEAAEYYRKAVSLVPEESGPHFALGRAYSNSGQYGEAEKELRLAISLHETTTALDTLGVVLLYQGRDQEAIYYISRALSIGPERDLWWMNLGTAYRHLKLIPESEHAYHRGLELAEAELSKNPRNGYTRSVLAYLYARLGDRERAATEIAQALQLSPNDSDVLFLATDTYNALGRLDDALDVLRASPKEVIADVNRWPDIVNLHQDARFTQLLSSTQIK